VGTGDTGKLNATKPKPDKTTAPAEAFRDRQMKRKRAESAFEAGQTKGAGSKEAR
jgi:hypothetical protein